VKRRGLIGSSLLLLTVAAIATALAAWKRESLRKADEAALQQPEPVQVITVAHSSSRPHARTATSVGTVMALRSITLRNELAGTVEEVMLVPGAVVEEGTVLVALDVSVEEAELKAEEAESALAETLLGRIQRASESHGASEADVDRAKAQLDIMLARVARTRAVIDRKTLRAPFRARVGMADVHPGQYLNEGTQLTTLQGVDDAVHVDFTVAQQIAAGLREGLTVEVFVGGSAAPLPARIVALDARIDPATRNALVRALIEGVEGAPVPSPGASVRVRVPVGEQREAVVVPVSALGRGPAGDHVFVIETSQDGQPRAHLRPVQGGEMLGDEVVIEVGLEPGLQVAASGAFKLYEGALVSIASEPAAPEAGR
jgi:membrane fusion protein, multidrug efflux system